MATSDFINSNTFISWPIRNNGIITNYLNVHVFVNILLPTVSPSPQLIFAKNIYRVALGYNIKENSEHLDNNINLNTHINESNKLKFTDIMQRAPNFCGPNMSSTHLSRTSMYKNYITVFITSTNTNNPNTDFEKQALHSVATINILGDTSDPYLYIDALCGGKKKLPYLKQQK